MMRKKEFVVVALVFTSLAFCKSLKADSPLNRSVITIYNKTDIHLDYQLRILPEETFSDPDPEWTEWNNRHHKWPNGGWQASSYDVRAQKFQIKFDMIGGDDEYTEKRYNLDFNVVRTFGNIKKTDGKPYVFSFNGTKLLELKKCSH